jgi:hypothetical protein
MPFICRTATTQDADATPSVAVSAAAVAALVVAVEQEVARAPLSAFERLGVLGRAAR